MATVSNIAGLAPAPTAGSISDILNAPALDPPPGVTQHFSTRADEYFWSDVVIATCTIVAGLLLIMRMYTKLRHVRKIDLTDYASVVGFIFFLSMMAIGKLMYNTGAGVHQWNLSRRQLNQILYYVYLQDILYCPAMSSIKLAILLQYIYLLAPNRSINPTLYLGSYILIWANLVFYIISMAVSTWACTPREKSWNDLVEGTCLNNNAMIMITFLWNICSDIVILLLPTWTVWKLRIPTRKRVGIVGLFATGGLACIADAFAIMYLLRMAGDNADVSYNVAWLGNMVMAELTLGICVICFLSLPKFMEVKGKFWLSTLTRISDTAFSIASIARTRGSSAVGNLRDSEATAQAEVAITPLPAVKLGRTLSQVELRQIIVDDESSIPKQVVVSVSTEGRMNSCN